MQTKQKQLNKTQNWSHIQRRKTKNGILFNSTEDINSEGLKVCKKSFPT